MRSSTSRGSSRRASSSRPRPSRSRRKSKLLRVASVAEVSTVVSARVKRDSRSTGPSSMGAAARTRFAPPPACPGPRASARRPRPPRPGPAPGARPRPWRRRRRSTLRRSRSRPSRRSDERPRPARAAPGARASSRSRVPRVATSGVQALADLLALGGLADPRGPQARGRLLRAHEASRASPRSPPPPPGPATAPAAPGSRCAPGGPAPRPPPASASWTRREDAPPAAVQAGQHAVEPAPGDLHPEVLGGGVLHVVRLVQDEALVGREHRRLGVVLRGPPHRQVGEEEMVVHHQELGGGRPAAGALVEALLEVGAAGPQADVGVAPHLLPRAPPTG